MFGGTFDGTFDETFDGTFDETFDGTFDGTLDGPFDGTCMHSNECSLSQAPWPGGGLRSVHGGAGPMIVCSELWCCGRSVAGIFPKRSCAGSGSRPPMRYSWSGSFGTGGTYTVMAYIVMALYSHGPI